MRAIRLYTGFILLMLFLIASLGRHVVYASSNIDPDSDGSSYAYGENVGWVNLKSSSGDGVFVVDPLLLGYAWSENVGWINFSCLNSASCGTLNWGVLNDGTGNLSGYAWGENVGWINFAPTGGGVTINTETGIFSGTAWGENIGWISFGSNGSVTFRVKTSWRGAANQVPNLSYSSETGYGSDGITPDSGTASTSFIYKVIYTDGNNDPPAYIKVHIDGDATGTYMNLDTSAASTLRDGNYTDGEQFYYTTSLAAGTHNYYFDASDGIDTAILPSSGILSGPTVSDLTFSDLTFPSGIVGISYFTALTVSGGTPPYTWSIPSGLPPGLTLDSSTGFITGTPTTQGTYGFTAYVTDSNSYTYSKAFSITINPNQVNNPPWLIPIGAKNINEGVNLYFMISGIDPDGDMLTYGATGIPTGATFNASTGTFSWTPDYAQAGTYNVTFTVSDGSLTASETVQITINNVNQPPVLNPIGLKSVNEGTNLNLTIIGSDPDGDLLTYSATGLPQGATFDVTTQTFNWTPDYTQAGAYSVIFTVSDGSGTASETMTINVNDVPTSNTLTGSDVTVAPSTDVPLTIIFDNVTSPGSTTVSTSETGQPPPSGFKLGTPPIYYDITTTATYSGLIQVCFTYDETQFTSERNLKLFHLEGTIWVDITDTGYPDIVNNIICGTTTNLSPFIIAYVFYPAELPRTGQTTCYDTAGAVIPCPGTGQDGEIQAGMPWPDPRFTDNGDGTVTDNLTGLMWTKNANLPGTSKTFQQALDYVKGMNTSGYSDWRLPNINEIESLIDAGRSWPSLPAGHSFSNVQNYYYWSSTSYTFISYGAWAVNMSNGDVNSGNNFGNVGYVWAVRSGQVGIIQLPRTGQTTCYDSSGNIISCTWTEQDGDIQAGVTWPSPRFTDNGDETVTDNLTGFMWTKNANLPGTSAGWQQTLDYVKGMNQGIYPNFGYADWRLPNRKELQSLIDHSRYNPTLPLGHPFTTVQSYFYWSSTSYAYDNNYAWAIDMTGGHLYGVHKFGLNSFLWPVRSGRRIAPSLSYSSEPGYGSDGVNPDSGTASTTFTYKVIYKDANNDAPSFIKVHIDGDPIGTSMNLDTSSVSTLRDGNYTNGEQYYYTTTLTAGVHSYYFSASDGVDTVRLPSSGWLEGPTVSDLTFIEGWLLPSGIVGISYVTLLPVSGGTPPYTWSIPSGLPPGLTLDSSTGFIRGTPTTQGTYGFTAYVTDSNSYTYSRAFSIIIDPGCILNTYFQDADNDTYGDVSVTTQTCTQPSGYVLNSSDCNDSNASINPGAAEVCNGVDDNCNSQVDEGVQNTYYQDADSDTYGNAAVTTQACTVPVGYVANSTDCNDSNASINPGAAEVCNGVDDNCNGQIDEGVQNAYYRDADNDTYGNASITTQACIAPSGYVSNSADCNDNNASINPVAAELCNSVDDNCNTLVDEGVQNTYYRDSDNDTYGNVSLTTQACAQPSGYVSNNTDCNDGNASINPVATEVCNGIDDNCNGQIDEGAGNLFSDDFNDNYIDPTKWTDISGNSVTESNGITKIDQAVTDNGGNLNSKWIDINPNNTLTITRKVKLHYANNYFVGKFEIIFDQAFFVNIEYAQMSYGGYPHCASYGFFIVKNNSTHSCPPQSDVSLRIEPVWDQWFDEKIVYNPATGVLEYFINDQKRTEFNVGALPAGTNKMRLYFNSWGWWTGHYHYFDDLVVSQGGSLLNTYYLDLDNDTYGNASVTTQSCSAPSGYVTNSTDCNDSNGSINPGVVEVCNGVDDNCNTLIDEGGLNTYYRDADNDTYGNSAVTTQSCSQPSGYVTNSTDCNDSNASINPAAIEVCNGVNDNCNGQTDEGVQNTYYRDADNDTYGNASVTTQACTAPSGYVSNSSDCNDSNASIKPGAIEVCNGEDDNCNGQVDEGVQNVYYRDADADTYGNASVTTQACTQPSGYVSNSTDCSDGNASINPNATEVCNTIDDNCNGQVDEGCPVVEVCDGIDNDGDSLIDEDFPAGNTSCGSDVQITPDGVTFTFPSVTLSGDTTVTTSGTGQPPPSGFKLGATPTYYEIASTAAFSGTVEVCINYDETQFATERSLKLFHWEGSWKDITTSIDTAANVICGNTTSFSPFIVAESSSSSSSSPTIVSGVSLSARMDGDHVILTWSTGAERDNEGFIILRAESAGGTFTSITSAMIPATGGFGMRATYTFTDSRVESGKTYYYRLQDIDSKGGVTAHQVIPVTVAVAKGDESPQEVTGKEDVTASVAQQTKAAGNKETTEGEYEQPEKSDTWVSVVGANVPLTLTLSPEGRGGEGDHNDIPSLNAQVKEDHFTSRGSTTMNEVAMLPDHATTEVVALQSPGPSSFSVSIEDDKGNIIVVRRVEDTVSASKTTGDLEVTKESGSVTLTWKGRSGAKGFILHRTEKGKEDYTAITSLIPYFGRDDKDIFLYKFTDNNIKPEVRYDYRLEVVKSDQTDRTAQR